MLRKLSTLAVVAAILSTLPLAAVSAERRVAVSVRLKSLDSAVAELMTLAKALEAPVPAEVISAQLGGAVGNPGLAGIEKTAPIMIHVIMENAAPEADAVPEKPGVVFVLPSADGGAAFLAVLAQAFETSAEEDGVKAFSSPRPGTPVAAQEVFVRVVGQRILCGGSADDVRTVAALPADASTAAKGTVSITLDMQSLYPPFAAAMSRSAAMMKQAAEAAPSPAGMAMNPAAIVQAEGDALIAIMKQIKTLTVDLRASAQAIEISSLVTPVPGTVYASVLESLRKPNPAYLGCLPADAVMAFSGNGMQIFDTIAEPYADLMAKIYSGMGPQMSGVSDLIRADMLSMMAMYTGDFAFALLPNRTGAGLGIVEIFAVNDPAAAKLKMDAILGRYNETYAKMLPGISLVMNPPRTYAGVSISSFRYHVADTGTNASPAAAAMPFMGWLTRMNGEIAYVGNNMVFTMGAPDLMNRTLDGIRTRGEPITKWASFTKLFPTPPAELVTAWTLQPMGTIKALLKGLPNMDATVADALPDDQGGLSGVLVREDAGVRDTLRISVPSIVAIKNAGPVLGAAMMQLAMSGMTGGAPGMSAATGPQACINNLRRIDASKEMLAMEKDLQAGDTVKDADLLPYMKGGVMPICPAGGTYTINPIGKSPACSIEGHTLD